MRLRPISSFRLTSGRAAGLAGALAIAVPAAIIGCIEGTGPGNARNVAASSEALTVEDVEDIIVRAVSQASASGVPITVAVTDREGEVLGAFAMAGQDLDADGTVDGLSEGNLQAAISKAASAAAFQSEQDAFTSRTAYFIVQGNFPPGIRNTAAGPLFGVQDSGLVSTDVRASAYDKDGNAVGIGISGEIGGVPLFKNGAPVGGVGVDVADVLVAQGGAPTLQGSIQNDRDEAIALAAARRFLTPAPIQAQNVYGDGIQFPFVAASLPAEVAPLAADTQGLSGLVGAANIADVRARFPVRASPLPAEVRTGGQYGLRGARRYAGRLVASRAGGGFGPGPVTIAAPAVPAGGFVNVDRQAGVSFTADYRFTGVPVVAMSERVLGGVRCDERFAPIASVDPPPGPASTQGGLTAAEVEAIIARGVRAADSASSAIRLPRGVPARNHVAVVDARGNILGVYRMGDGTQFSHDVAIQKARTCAFFSKDLFAASARGIGYLCRPFFPDGIDGTEPGPLVRLRDLVNRGLVTEEAVPSLTLLDPPARAPQDGTATQDANILVPGFQTRDDYAGFTAPGAALTTIRARLEATGGFTPLADRPDVGFVSPGLMAGMQTFAGGVPLFRDGKLIGAVGASGDGIDEDDLTAYEAARGFDPVPGTRIDEVSEAIIATVLVEKAEILAEAMETHPDATMAAVYGPLFRRERDAIADRLSRGLEGVRLPYVKLPRNPAEGR